VERVLPLPLSCPRKRVTLEIKRDLLQAECGRPKLHPLPSARSTRRCTLKWDREGATEKRGRPDDFTFELLTEDGYDQLTNDPVPSGAGRKRGRYWLTYFGAMLVPLGHVLPHTQSHHSLKLVRLPVPPRPRRLFSTSWEPFGCPFPPPVPVWCPSGARCFEENRRFRPARLLPRYPQIFPQFPPPRLGLASFIWCPSRPHAIPGSSIHSIATARSPWVGV
jgi:hypothetical protein